jgi:hypothetical protein
MRVREIVKVSKENNNRDHKDLPTTARLSPDLLHAKKVRTYSTRKESCGTVHMCQQAGEAHEADDYRRGSITTNKQSIHAGGMSESSQLSAGLTGPIMSKVQNRNDFGTVAESNREQS